MGGFVGLVYPLADVTTQWWENKYDRAQFSVIDKLLLHSTETEGWPSYRGDGSDAPTLTYHPRIRKWRQHNYINTSARALADPTSTPVRENRDNVVQIEIVGYADEILADSVGGLKISQLSDQQLQDIADFYKWLSVALKCPIQCTLEFPPYRPGKNVHLTSSQYDAYKGLIGHMHVPYPSTHTDPGNINVSKILAYAKGSSVEEDMPTVDEIWAKPVYRTDGKVPVIQEVADAKTNTLKLISMVSTIAEKVGVPVDVDEAAIAAALVPALVPALKDAVTAVLANAPVGATPEAVADAVVAEFNTRLAQ